MRRSKSQLNAITRAYYKKQYEKQNELINKYGLKEIFKDSKYKTMTWFINWAKKQNLIPINERI